MRNFCLLIVCVMAGCVAIPAVQTTSQVNVFPDIIQWVSFPFEPHAYEQWRVEAHKRWPNPIIFACHGGGGWTTEKIGGRMASTRVWMLYPEGEGRTEMPVESVAWTLHNAYPNRDIILCVCNRNGEFDCHVPRVWYAKAKVWATPDGYTFWHEQKIGEGSVGSVWEFVQGDGKPLVTSVPEIFPSTWPTTQPIGK